MRRWQVVLCGLLVLGAASLLAFGTGSGLVVAWGVFHQVDVLVNQAVDEQIRMARAEGEARLAPTRRRGMCLDWVEMPTPGPFTASPKEGSWLPAQVIGEARFTGKAWPHLAMLHGRRYAELEAALEGLRGAPVPASGADPLGAALAELGADARIAEYAARWIEARQDCFWAHLLLAEALQHQAWVYRTSSYLSRIPAERWELFVATNARALEALRRAVFLRPDLARGWAALAQMKAGRVGIDGEVRDAILRAIELDPLQRNAYDTWINFSQPQWGGSVARLQLIAERALALADQDPRMVFVAVVAFETIERALGSDERPLDSPQVRARLERFLEAVMQRYPGAHEALGFRARLAYRAKDEARGRTLEAAALEAGSLERLVDEGRRLAWSRTEAEAHQGRRYLERAIQLGSPRALVEYGHLVADGVAGLEADPGRALRGMLPAANQAHRQAMVAVGDLYREGRPGLPQDPAAAYQWYLEGARSENGLAFERLARMHLAGEGVAVSPQAALAWLEAGAARSHVGCMLAAAGLYAGNSGVPRDLARARVLLTEASHLGSDTAEAWLLRLEAAGGGTP